MLCEVHPDRLDILLAVGRSRLGGLPGVRSRGVLKQPLKQSYRPGTTRRYRHSQEMGKEPGGIFMDV